MGEKKAMLKGFSRYEVSDKGTVRSKVTGKLLKPWTDRDGYKRLKLTNDKGVRSAFYLHRLVWTAFNGKLKPGIEIDHLEGERQNNALEFLIAVTKKQNLVLKKQRDSKRYLFNKYNKTLPLRAGKNKLGELLP